MVKLMVTLSPELGSDRNTIELDFVGASEHRTIINQLASTFNVAERDKITDRLCFRLPERKRPLNTNDLLSDAIFGPGPRTIVLGLDYAKDFILNLTDPTQQKKSLFMIKKELSDVEFVFEFIRQGGVRVITNLMMELTGSLLAYCLSSLELIMSQYIGWEDIGPEHIEKIMELIDGWDGGAGKTNVVNCALRIAVLLARRGTPEGEKQADQMMEQFAAYKGPAAANPPAVAKGGLAGSSSMSTSSFHSLQQSQSMPSMTMGAGEAWGFAIVDRAIIENAKKSSKQPYQGLLSCISSTEMNMQLNSLTLINQLIRATPNRLTCKSLLDTLARLGINKVIQRQIHIENEEFRRQIYIFQQLRLDQYERLKKELYDKTNQQHEELLMRLWRAVFPDDTLQTRVSEQWKLMGFQGTDPATDFRGMGLLGLMNLIYIAENHANTFRRIVKEQASREDFLYPVAVSGISISQLLTTTFRTSDPVPEVGYGKIFNILFDHDNAFEELYAVVFQLLDRLWDEMQASYMDFPRVLAAVKDKVTEVMERSDTISSFERAALKGQAPINPMLDKIKSAGRSSMSVVLKEPANVAPAGSAPKPSISQAINSLSPKVVRDVSKTSREEVISLIREQKLASIKKGAAFKEVPKKAKHDKTSAQNNPPFIFLRCWNDSKTLRWARTESADAIPESLPNIIDVDEILTVHAVGATASSKSKKVDEEASNSFVITSKNSSDTILELLALNRFDFVNYVDGLRKLVNPSADFECPESLTDIEVLSGADQAVKLLNLSGLPIPEEVPEIPAPPPNLSFYYQDDKECENFDWKAPPSSPLLSSSPPSSSSSSSHSNPSPLSISTSASSLSSSSSSSSGASE